MYYLRIKEKRDPDKRGELSGFVTRATERRENGAVTLGGESTGALASSKRGEKKKDGYPKQNLTNLLGKETDSISPAQREEWTEKRKQQSVGNKNKGVSGQLAKENSIRALGGGGEDPSHSERRAGSEIPEGGASATRKKDKESQDGGKREGRGGVGNEEGRGWGWGRMMIRD